MFADDVVLMAETMAGLNTLFSAVSSFCRDNKLQVNATKTKVLFGGCLRHAYQPGSYVSMEEFSFEVVTKFKYLGLTFDHQASPKVMIDCLVAKGHKAFHWLRKFV